MRKLFSKWVLYLLLIKNNALMIQSIVCNCFNITKRSFCKNMWQWTKHGSTTSLWSQIGSQLSGQQQGESIQNDQRHKHRKARFWPPLFWDEQGILFIDYIEKGRTINSKYYIALLEHLKEEIAKKWPQIKKEKSALLPRQYTISQVNRNNDKTTWIAFRTASTPTLSSRSGHKRLLVVCRPQKNAPGEEIWLQWRSDIRNWGIFWGQRQIILQK